MAPGVIDSVVRRIRLTPTAAEMTSRLGQIEAVIDELDVPRSDGLSDGPKVTLLRDALEQIKKQLPVKVSGEIDDAIWQDPIKTPVARRRALYAELGRLWTLTRDVNRGELRSGLWHLTALIGVFLILVTGYAVQSYRAEGNPIGSDADVIDVGRLLANQDVLMANVKQADAATRPKAREALVLAKAGLRAGILKVSCDAETLKDLGAFEADIDNDHTDSAASFNTLRSHLEKQLASRPGSCSGCLVRRWAEIAIWAEIGTLVGLLFYLAGILANGVFRIEEVPMFWTEVAISPVVIPAVFFIGSLVGLSSPDQANRTTTLGIAFVLGFSIRRTVGLLDLAKKTILPDPDTSPSTPKPATTPGKSSTTTTLVMVKPAPGADGRTSLSIKVQSLTANAGTPSGTVVLKPSSGSLDSPVKLDGTGAASASGNLPTGSYTVTAEYSGDATFAPSKVELKFDVPTQ